MKWWADEDYVHLMVAMARDLDAAHPDRVLLSLGHSPSWLCATTAMLRGLDHRPQNIRFIPFSGRLHQLDSKAYRAKENGECLTFTKDTMRRVSEGSLGRYFNYLADQKLSPLDLVHIRDQSGQKPVLVEMASMGSGLATFLSALDQYSKQQGTEDKKVDELLDVLVYKMNAPSTSQAICFAMNPCDDEQTLSAPVPLRVVSGVQGAFMDFIGGYKGNVESNAGLYADQERTVGRFMPYFSIVDGYDPDSYLSRHTPPAAGLRPAPAHGISAIKAALRKAASTPPDVHNAHVASAHKKITALTPKSRVNGWIGYYGYH